MNDITNKSNWDELTEYLPANWKELAKQTGAIVRERNFTAKTMLQTLMIHLWAGLSLRATATVCSTQNIVKISDVSILDCLIRSRKWLSAICKELIKNSKAQQQPKLFASKYHLYALDASVVCEPNAKEDTWRIHYVFDLANLTCVDYVITDNKIGESLSNFQIEEDAIYVVDRGYSRANEILHTFNNKGFVVVRVIPTNLRCFDPDTGKKINILNKLNVMASGDYYGFPVVVKNSKNESVAYRISVYRKQAKEIEKSVRKVKKVSSKKSKVIKQSTVEAAKYIIVATTLPDSHSDKDICEIYRYRWQVELSFKRMKSLLHLGYLKKYDKDSALAWLQGKMFIALFVEHLLALGKSFSP